MSSGRRVWVFGDDVNTDLIIPGRFLDNYDPSHLAAHAMEGVDRDFSKKVRRGDIVIAGRNFGCGSSREQAVIALKAAGISAVIAKSFARIFYRNAVNLGLPALVSEKASLSFTNGDSVDLDPAMTRIASDDGARSATLEPPAPHVRMILEAGGLVTYLKKRLESNGSDKNV